MSPEVGSQLELKPFRALHYDASKIPDPGAVWAPPYDVISTEEAEALRRRHPRNIVRITLPEPGEPDRYTVAARLLDSWIEEGTLVHEPEPCLYVHRHTYEGRDGVRRTRTGLWGLLRLVPLDAGLVIPHERTFSGPKADRLALMRATRAQLSAVFVTAADPSGRLLGMLEGGDGAVQARAEFPAGEVHELSRVTDPAAIADFREALADDTLLIADGHHRYETALAYRDERRASGSSNDGGHEYVLVCIASERDPGLRVEPTHRVLAGPAEVDWAAAVNGAGVRFDVREIPESQLAGAVEIVDGLAGRPAFVLAVAGREGGWRMELRAEPDGAAERSKARTSLGAVALHDVFLAEVVGLDRGLQESGGLLTYTRDPAEAIRRIRRGPARAAALVSAPRMDQIREATRGGERLPPKTTFFWPKVPTGPAIHRIDPDEPVTLPG